MPLQDIKNQIISYINQILVLDFSKFYIESVSIVPWNQMDSQETKKFIEEMLDVLKKIKDNMNVLDFIPYTHLNNLKNYLEQIKIQHDNILNIQPNQITTHHHNTLNYFNNLNELLRLTDLYTQIKLTPNINETINKLKEVNNQIKDFKSEDFKTATLLVDDLIQKKVSYEDKTIKESLGNFLNRANEHKIFQKQKSFWTLKFSGQRSWMFAAIFMASIVAKIVFSFIEILEINQGNISPGAAILRISSLIIPSYFMIFFLNQFSYHKRMYEIYSFKNTSMNMMTDLMKANPSKADDILKRGLDVLFSEPEVKNGGKYDKQLISDLLNFVKDKVK